jgi:hypothetical protein
MKHYFKKAFLALGLMAGLVTLQSCNDDDDNYYYYPGYLPNALVTVRPAADGSFTMQLDDSTTLTPANMQQSPFGNKEVRALVNCYKANSTTNDDNRVNIVWIDSIRTKLPVATTGNDDDKTYGNDPIEIVRDWVTVAEDGYLTLRFRTRWGNSGRVHYINLVTGTNPDDPFDLVLRQDAKGDTNGSWGDALIAFNLNELKRVHSDKVKLTLHWKSYSGEKSATFDLRLRPAASTSALTTRLPLSAKVK